VLARGVTSSACSADNRLTFRHPPIAFQRPAIASTDVLK